MDLEAQYFKQIFGEKKLGMSVLAVGGEASIGPYIQEFAPLASDIEFDVIPKCGHWLGEWFPSQTVSIAVTAMFWRDAKASACFE